MQALYIGMYGETPGTARWFPAGRTFVICDW